MAGVHNRSMIEQLSLEVLWHVNIYLAGFYSKQVTVLLLNEVIIIWK